MLATALFWKATDFGNKVMLTESPLLFSFGSLMVTYVHSVNKNIPREKENKMFSLLSPNDSFSWFLSHKYVHWNATQKCFNPDVKPKFSMGKLFQWHSLDNDMSKVCYTLMSFLNKMFFKCHVQKLTLLFKSNLITYVCTI